jgi:histidinol-phosphate aminotransferase
MLDHYKQYEAVPVEEVNAQLKVESDERKRLALAVVDPLDLSRTTWPHLPDSRIVNAITFAARRGLQGMPEPHATPLRLELAHRHGVPAGRVVVGDGAAALLGAATQALIEPGDELITPWPSYGLYPLLVRRARGLAVPVAGHGVDPILAAVNERTRLVALCNPNDPTGELLSVADLHGLLTDLPERVVVLLDEALRDYVDAEDPDATLGLLEAHPRLLLFRSFSKAWGLAGLRCGYALGGPGSEELLAQLEPDLGVNELAVAGALEALRSSTHSVARRLKALAAERASLTDELLARDIEVTRSQANFLWMKVPDLDGTELTARLESHGVKVAPGGLLGDPDRVRVAVLDPVSGDRFLRALDQALGREELPVPPEEAPPAADPDAPVQA